MSIALGLIGVTEIGAPSSFSSMRSASVKPFTACLVAEYMPCSGSAMSEATLPTLTIAPPPFALRYLAAISEP